MDWPENFLRKVCSAFSIPFEWDKNKGVACSIDAKPWVELHINCNILSIDLKRDDGIVVSLARVPIDLEKATVELRNSMGNSIGVTLSSGAN